MRDTLFRDRAKVHLRCTVAACWKPRAWLSTIRVTHRLLRVTHACWREQDDMQQRNISPLVKNFNCFSDSASRYVPDAITEINTVRTAAWDSRTVASCTDKWQPEPHLPHARGLLLPPILTSQAWNRTGALYDSLITHTHTM